MKSHTKKVPVERRRLTPKKPRKTLRVAFILDESGSMSPRQGQVISAFNEYLQGLRREDKVRYEVTLTKFSTYARTVYANFPVSEAPELSLANYHPSGGTALIDAVGDTIKALEAQQRADDIPAIVVVQTDGEENSSSRWTSAQIRDLIREKEGERGWCFVYLGADQDAWSHAQLYGFQMGNTIRYDSHQTGGVYANLTLATHGLAAQYASTGTVRCNAVNTMADFDSTGNVPPNLKVKSLKFSEAKKGA